MKAETVIWVRKRGKKQNGRSNRQWAVHSVELSSIIASYSEVKIRFNPLCRSLVVTPPTSSWVFTAMSWTDNLALACSHQQRLMQDKGPLPLQQHSRFLQCFFSRWQFSFCLSLPRNVLYSESSDLYHFMFNNTSKTAISKACNNQNIPLLQGLSNTL